MNLSDERLLVAQAVLAGQINQSHLTDSEIDEVFDFMTNQVIEEELDRAAQRGLSVFGGVHNGQLN